MRAQFRELRALCDLIGDRLPEAQARFGPARAAADGEPRCDCGRFQKYFFDRGEYRKLKIYTDYLLPRGGAETLWYHALVQAAFFDGNGSERTIAALDPAFKKNNDKALALLAAVHGDLRRGRFDYIFDKSGSALAYFDVRERRTHSLLPGFDFVDFDRQVKEGLSYFQLTLDAGLQRNIARIFSGFSGTLLLLELPQNSILAAYSKPRYAGAANAVFGEGYPPGSIVTIISLLAYLRQPDQGVFPYDCPGRMTIGKNVFQDSMAHRRVNDAAVALARSCDLSFARMGLAVGRQRLAGLLELFRFNSGPWHDWFLTFQSGRCDLQASGDWVLANLAVGQGDISLTTVHAAMLAAVFSQNGMLSPPYLIEDAKSLLNLGYYSHRSRPQRLLADDLNFRRVKRAMQASLNESNAAGLAVKIATVGNRRQGADTLAIGFFPAANPRYAFAFRLDGTADGMRFLRDLADLLRAKRP